MCRVAGRLGLQLGHFGLSHLDLDKKLTLLLPEGLEGGLGLLDLAIQRIMTPFASNLRMASRTRSASSPS